ncbi:MAG: response regulator [Bdellovibrionota bacterium]
MEKKQILIVDDEVGIREMLRLAFQMEDYPVVMATNGQEALDLLPTIHPGMIVLDLMMPVMDGKRFKQALAPNPEWAKIPIVVVTAFPDAAAAMGPGVTVLEKPLDLEVLLDKAKKFCG